MLSRSRSRRFIAILLILAYAIFCGRSAYVLTSWLWVVEGLAFLVAATGLALRRRWSAYLIYVLAVRLAVVWTQSIWLAASSDGFDGVSLGRRALSLAPGLLMVALAAFCCVVAAAETAAEPRPA